MSRYSAGILLYSHNSEGTLCFLLGRDFRHKYSDFGGGSDITDSCKLDTASREFYEETCGVVSDRDLIKQRLHSAGMIQSQSFTGKPYYMYVLKVPYSDEYITTFDIIRRHIQHKPLEQKYKEKLGLRWFTKNDIMNERDMRTVFYDTFSQHIDSIHKLTMRKVLKH